MPINHFIDRPEDSKIPSQLMVGDTVYIIQKEEFERRKNTKYELKSLNKDELDLFFEKKDFKGINVTLPYKKEVIKYLDEVDEIVKRTNTCNCIINKNNKLVGYNTDYYGFKFLIEENDIIIENRKIAILGSGGTFSTIKALMNDLNAKEVYNGDEKLRPLFIKYFSSTNMHLKNEFSYVLKSDIYLDYQYEFEVMLEYKYLRKQKKSLVQNIVLLNNM